MAKEWRRIRELAGGESFLPHYFQLPTHYSLRNSGSFDLGQRARGRRRILGGTDFSLRSPGLICSSRIGRVCIRRRAGGRSADCPVAF